MDGFYVPLHDPVNVCASNLHTVLRITHAMYHTLLDLTSVGLFHVL